MFITELCYNLWMKFPTLALHFNKDLQPEFTASQSVDSPVIIFLVYRVLDSGLVLVTWQDNMSDFWISDSPAWELLARGKSGDSLPGGVLLHCQPTPRHLIVRWWPVTGDESQPSSSSSSSEIVMARCCNVSTFWQYKQQPSCLYLTLCVRGAVLHRSTLGNDSVAAPVSLQQQRLVLYCLKSWLNDKIINGQS